MKYIEENFIEEDNPKDSNNEDDIEFFKSNDEPKSTHLDNLETKINNFNQTLFDYKKFKTKEPAKADNSDDLSLEEDIEDKRNFKTTKKPEFISFAKSKPEKVHNSPTFKDSKII